MIILGILVTWYAWRKVTSIRSGGAARGDVSSEKGREEEVPGSYQLDTGDNLWDVGYQNIL